MKNLNDKNETDCPDGNGKCRLAEAFNKINKNNPKVSKSDQSGTSQQIYPTITIEIIKGP
jgi:hypothetical protein